MHSRYNNLRKKEEPSKVLFPFALSNTFVKMTQQITKEFVIKEIQDHIEYYHNYIKMLDKNPDIPYSDEQFDLDIDKKLECDEILKMLERNQHTPESAFRAFTYVINARLY